MRMLLLPFRSRWRVLAWSLLVLLGSVLLGGCIGLGIGRGPAERPPHAEAEASATSGAGISSVNPTAAPDATSAPADAATPTVEPAEPVPTAPAEPVSDAVAQLVSVDSPPVDTVVGSPVTLVGRTARFPAGGVLSYRFLDATLQPLGSGEFPVSGVPGSVGTFSVSLGFTLPAAGGPISVELFERDASGAEIGGVRWPLYVAAPQAISFISPPIGTQVGSPVTVVGTVASIPNSQQLGFRVRASDAREIGAGTLATPGIPGRPGTFTAAITFTPPLDGGAISVELFEQGPNGAAIAPATLGLFVAPQPQVIAIDTPAPDSFVGSPVVITGRTARPPFNNVLGFAIYDSVGRQVGGGIFPVTPSGTGSAFRAQLSFNFPAQGGPLRIDLYDQDPSSGAFRATASRALRTAPTQQQILIDTPAAGTQVGSPVVLTGRTARYPTGGRLQWRIVNPSGDILGSGSFTVSGPAGEPARWVVSMPFNAPFAGGDVRADILEVDAAGVQVAQASVSLRVAPTPRQITITSPAPNTQVGSPMTITGRTNFFPFEATLNYRVRDSAGNELGSGPITVTRAGDAATFVHSLSFRLMPNGGILFVDVFAQDAATGATIASSTVQLRQ